MARIPFIEESDPAISADLLAKLKARRGGQIAEIDGVLLHNEALTDGWHALFGAFTSRCEIDFSAREIAILRIAHLTRARYPSFQHHRIALAGGIPQGKIDAIPAWHGSPLFDPRERAILAYADAMTETVQVPEPTFADLRRHFDDRQIVELTALIAGYNMVTRFTEAVDLEPR